MFFEYAVDCRSKKEKKDYLCRILLKFHYTKAYTSQLHSIIQYFNKRQFFFVFRIRKFFGK